MVVTDSRLGDAVRPTFLTFAGEVEPGPGSTSPAKSAAPPSPSLLSVTTMSRIGWASRRDGLPNCDGLEQARCRGDDRRGAFVLAAAGFAAASDRQLLSRTTIRAPAATRWRASARQSRRRQRDVPMLPVSCPILARQVWVGLDPPPNLYARRRARVPARDASPPRSRELVECLDLEPLEVNLFRGRSPQSHWQRVSAARSSARRWSRLAVPSTMWQPPPPISCSAAIPLQIVYDVDRIRDGKYHPQRQGDPARPSDLFDVGVVSCSRGRACRISSPCPIEPKSCRTRLN